MNETKLCQGRRKPHLTAVPAAGASCPRRPQGKEGPGPRGERHRDARLLAGVPDHLHRRKVRGRRESHLQAGTCGLSRGDFTLYSSVPWSPRRSRTAGRHCAAGRATTSDPCGAFPARAPSGRAPAAVERAQGRDELCRSAPGAQVSSWTRSGPSNPDYELLYQLRPGLFSAATLYNGYTDTMEKMLERLRMDLDYLYNRSLWLDTKIIFLTVFSILTGKKF